MDESKKKILIIEDEGSLLEMLVEKFTNEGFDVLQSDNGKDGLKMALENHPNIILLDIILPKMDGLTVLDKIRSDEWGKNANVVMLTNLNSAEDVQKAMESGAHDYLVKTDWKMEEIVEKVKQKLGMK